ncbi:Dps family protein [Mycoplasma crocodyli]|uniref:Neutrophil activating factor NapA (Bacterioferritin) n=1 Tax=Mycoplasma crocodyli (strain ATCC 51981 / MP145) TaxID=512564 RepID=D5E6C6_MYCCM|nr:DNA starvation/stationary phase protection protein [Mycoplasma crocodyli]ADE19553.1 neutrophil activating factor NapA (bacterioferritin) [Mycoplasma crocodyli MP145]
MKQTEQLKKLQASLSVLAQKIKNMHWHIYGETFFEVHEELDKLYDEVSGFTDEVAEKIVMFDELALGSYKEVLEESLISETKSKSWHCAEATKLVAEDMTVILDYIGKIKDVDFRIQPVLDEIVLSLHKAIWMFKKTSKN